MSKKLGLLGLLIGFLGFWLVTPAVIGEARMEKARDSIQRLAVRTMSLMQRATKTIVIALGIVALVLAYLSVEAVANPPNPFMSDKDARAYIRLAEIIGIAIPAILIATAAVVGVLYLLASGIGGLIKLATKSSRSMTILGGILFVLGSALTAWSIILQPG